MDFWTSDLHFGHAKLAKLRGYASVEEHDADIVRRINAQACVYTDTLYILGDVSFHKTKATVDILQQIIARDIVIKGNHDHRTKNAMGALLPGPIMVELDEFHHYLEREFMVWEDVSGAEGMARAGSEQLIVMNHFPLMHWHKQDKGAWQLHGHLHGNPSGVPGKIMDMGWDKWWKLLTLEDIAAYMQPLPVRGNHHTEVFA